MTRNARASGVGTAARAEPVNPSATTVTRTSRRMRRRLLHTKLLSDLQRGRADSRVELLDLRDRDTRLRGDRTERVARGDGVELPGRRRVRPSGSCLAAASLQLTDGSPDRSASSSASSHRRRAPSGSTGRQSSPRRETTPVPHSGRTTHADQGGAPAPYRPEALQTSRARRSASAPAADCQSPPLSV